MNTRYIPFNATDLEKLAACSTCNLLRITMAPLALGICRYAVVKQDIITGSWVLAEHGCPHLGSGGERQAHEEQCGYRPKECQHCQQIMKAREVQLHEEQCEYRPVQCGHLGCNAALPALKLNLHEDECEYRLVSCPLCEEKIAVCDREEHSKVCKYRLVPCPRCDVKVAACLVESSHRPECQPKCPLCKEAFLFANGEEHFKVCPEAVARCPKSGCPYEVKRGDMYALTVHVLSAHAPARRVPPPAETEAAEGEESDGLSDSHQGAGPLQNGAATTKDAALVLKSPSLASESTSGLTSGEEPPVVSDQNNQAGDTSAGAHVQSLGLDLLAVVAETKQDQFTTEVSARGQAPTAEPAREGATGPTAMQAGEGANTDSEQEGSTPDSGSAQGVRPSSPSGDDAMQEESTGLRDDAAMPEVRGSAGRSSWGAEKVSETGGDQIVDERNVVVPARFRVQKAEEGAPPTPSQTSPSPILIDHDDFQRDPPAVKALQLLRADRKAWSEADKLIKDEKDLLALERHVEAEGRTAVRSDLLRVGRVKKREEGESLVKVLWGFRCGFSRLFLYILTGLKANRGGKLLKGRVFEQIVEELGCSRVIPDGFCQQLQSDKKPRGRPPKDSGPGQAEKRAKGLDGFAQKRKKLDELGDTDLRGADSDSDSDAPIGETRRKLSSRRQQLGSRKILGSILDGMEEEDGPLFRAMLRVADKIESAPDGDTDKPMNLIRIRNKINGKQLDSTGQQPEYTLQDLSDDMQLISEHTYDTWSDKDAERIAEQARRLHLLFVRNRDMTEVKHKLAWRKAAG
ncbi:hypothetical protein KFL_006420020 [Klebsormidium nitens]|uniref:TRAF-type domain-containing protein n=1 Tax=Klebsormidium nitens TaxID=105231 RepID=A0A1Y1INV0_KLENI|nr:hypothetical protein KFL_006420020 [Klebsormidium nitens]|eukprot:GAQ90456.1 hypothetical protein KFL_006420020 [Klebsormidium nitens]